MATKAEELKEEVVMAALQKHGGDKAAAAKTLGVSRGALQRALARFDRQRREKIGGRRLEEFRQTHDKNFIVPHKIRTTLKALGSRWVYELEFVRLAGVNLNDLGNYRSQFEDHIVNVKRDGSKRVWAGTRELADKMREMVQ